MSGEQRQMGEAFYTATGARHFVIAAEVHVGRWLKRPGATNGTAVASEMQARLSFIRHKSAHSAADSVRNAGTPASDAEAARFVGTKNV